MHNAFLFKMCSSTDYCVFRYFFLVWMIRTQLTNGVISVSISSMRVPKFVRSGSESGAVLDCLYTLDSREQSHNSGLVVKWFFNHSLNPVYQWIHNERPRDSGVLRGRLKLDHKASNNNLSMYRALKIIKPTMELSGEYECLVSTYHGEDSRIKSMIVFVPEKRMDFFHCKEGSKMINVSCQVEGVYPKPVLFLYKDPSIKHNGLIENVIVNTAKSQSGTYNMITTAIFPIEVLTTLTVFDCELQIPGTFYRKRKTTLYFPVVTGNRTTIILPLSISYIVVLIITYWIMNSS